MDGRLVTFKFYFYNKLVKTWPCNKHTDKVERQGCYRMLYKAFFVSIEHWGRREIGRSLAFVWRRDKAAWHRWGGLSGFHGGCGGRECFHGPDNQNGGNRAECRQCGQSCAESGLYLGILHKWTSSQKLGRHASRWVRSVWKSLGWVSFRSKKFGPNFFYWFSCWIG